VPIVKLNAFELENLEEVLRDLKCCIYEVVGVPSQGGDRFRFLNLTADELSRLAESVAVPWSPGDKDFVVIFNPQVRVQDETFVIRDRPVRVKLHRDGRPVSEVWSSFRHLLYEVARAKLAYHGYWPAHGKAYSIYFRFGMPELVRGRQYDYCLYRGVEFRFEALVEVPRVLMILDPVVRMVLRNDAWTMIAGLSVEQAKKKVENRYFVVDQFSRGTISKRVIKVVRLLIDRRAAIDELVPDPRNAANFV